MVFSGFIKLVTFIVLLMSVITCISACDKESLPDLPAHKSFILFRGYPYSGIHCIYWKYDLDKKELNELNNQEYIDLLDYVYYQGNKNNVDEKKVEHHYDVIGKNIAKDFYLKLLASFNFNAEEKKKIRYVVSDDDNLISQDHLIKVLSDHKSNTITVIGSDSKIINVIKVKNRFWGQVLSPDGLYVAFFEHQPYVFSDGSNYKIKAVNLKTGEIYTLSDVLVSLPTALLWVDQKKYINPRK